MKLEENINCKLSFDDISERIRTKHVHRLHQYKGKFIPQLVRYFLDENTDDHKNKVFFKPKDTIIDPFLGSGTTLVVCAELELNCIGIDVSKFNCLISQVKIEKYNFENLQNILYDNLTKIKKYSKENSNLDYLKSLKKKLHDFNRINFINKDFKQKVISKEIEENKYGNQKLNEFFKINDEFIERLSINRNKNNKFNEKNSFLEIWYNSIIIAELNYYLSLIKGTIDDKIKNVMKIILSRVAHSCRLTKHFDLGTLKKPQILPYYCRKHKKICIPIGSSIKFFLKFTQDTIKRLKEYSNLRKNVLFAILNDDSRTINLKKSVFQVNKDLGKILEQKKIAGIFTSPPYVGQIDYHDQHAYAYDLLNIERKDFNEIGSKSNGKSKKARLNYIEDISTVLNNLNKYFKKDANLFFVANDKYNLYPEIAKRSNLNIVYTFKRLVSKRSEGDCKLYVESVFHMKKNT